jgi:hypothetical protein
MQRKLANSLLAWIVHAVNSFYPMKALRNLYETAVLQRKISHDGDPDLHWEFAE